MRLMLVCVCEKRTTRQCREGFFSGPRGRGGPGGGANGQAGRNIRGAAGDDSPPGARPNFYLQKGAAGCAQGRRAVQDGLRCAAERPVRAFETAHSAAPNDHPCNTLRHKQLHSAAAPVKKTDTSASASCPPPICRPAAPGAARAGGLMFVFTINNARKAGRMEKIL